MKKKRDEQVTGVEREEVLSPKELKRRERVEAAEKRRKVRQKDKVARFAGAILLGMVLLLGFLLWVAGEMKEGEQVEDKLTVPAPTLPSTIIVR